LRLDRSITLHSGSALGSWLTPPGGVPIPILMYHSISDRRESQAHPYFRTTTSPATFEEQVRFLRENGFTWVSMGKMAEYFQNPGVVGKAVGITFDDGFKDFYTEAFPILQKYGYGATVYLPTAYVEDRFMGMDCLSWSEVRELLQHGIEIGSHTRTHPVLHILKEQDLWVEVSDSKRDVEEGTGEKVSLFSYPYAFPQEDQKFTCRLSAILEECGYVWGVTTRIGRADSGQNRLFLKRIPINEDDDLELLQAKLQGAYDWVFRIQQMYRRFKRRK